MRAPQKYARVTVNTKDLSRRLGRTRKREVQRQEWQKNTSELVTQRKEDKQFRQAIQTDTGVQGETGKCERRHYDSVGNLIQCLKDKVELQENNVFP